MRESTNRTRNYRPGASRKAVALGSFRDQMADYARAERLRELRDAVHMSREKVAGEIGVTTKTLYAWENGGSIRWENAKKLGAFYGVDAEGLVSRDPDAVPDVMGDLTQRGDQGVLADLAAQLDRIEQNQQDLAALIEASVGAIMAQIEAIPGSSTPTSEQQRPATGRGRRRAA